MKFKIAFVLCAFPTLAFGAWYDQVTFHKTKSTELFECIERKDAHELDDFLEANPDLLQNIQPVSRINPNESINSPENTMAIYELSRSDIPLRMSKPLFFAVMVGHLPSVKVLVEHGASVHEVDPVIADGRTPLHYAARLGSEKIAAFLLEKNANIAPLDTEGLMPIQVARVHNRKSMVVYLSMEGSPPIPGPFQGKLGM